MFHVDAFIICLKLAGGTCMVIALFSVQTTKNGFFYRKHCVPFPDSLLMMLILFCLAGEGPTVVSWS